MGQQPQSNFSGKLFMDFLHVRHKVATMFPESDKPQVLMWLSPKEKVYVNKPQTLQQLKDRHQSTRVWNPEGGDEKYLKKGMFVQS